MSLIILNRYLKNIITFYYASLVFVLIQQPVFSVEGDSIEKLSNHEKIDYEGFIPIELAKRDFKHSYKNISEALQEINKYEKALANFKSFKEASDSYNEMIHSINPKVLYSGYPPEIVSERLDQIELQIHKQFYKYILHKKGLIITGNYPGAYWIKFKPATLTWNSLSWWLGRVRLKFSINDLYGWSTCDLTNVHIVLLDHEGFEIKKIYIDVIKKYGRATGEIVYQNKLKNRYFKYNFA